LSRTRPLALVLAVFALVAAAPASAASLATRLDRALSVSGVSRSATGALAIDLGSGRVVYGRNAVRPLRPASNEKLTVALAALDKLGPSFRVRTKVVSSGRLDRTVWRGHLVLKGFGDPALGRSDLARLADQLHARGIRRVTGTVIADESYFDARRTAPGWKASFYKRECPPLSALIVDEGKVGRVKVDNPALAAARAFRRALRAEGISTAAGARVGSAARPARALAEVFSPPLARLVTKMNRKSDNFVAEMLMKVLGAEARKRGTTAAGAIVVRNVLKERGVPLAGVRIADGSGLSLHDRLTARALAALLISAWSDPDVRLPFVRSLPVAGLTGTLEDRMERPPARGNVRAKTGTTREASALSGYVRSRYVFAILQNGNPIPWWHARRGQDRFAQILAGS
jgi:D-alanyl-D-alanine carboxypeptidase/D-alanyl-D-alanine-endopeptidase (penicillin-binding protein 4)